MRLPRKRLWQLIAPLMFVGVVMAKFFTIFVIWATVMSVWLSITTWNKFCNWLDND